MTPHPQQRETEIWIGNTDSPSAPGHGYEGKRVVTGTFDLDGNKISGFAVFIPKKKYESFQAEADGRRNGRPNLRTLCGYLRIPKKS